MSKHLLADRSKPGRQEGASLPQHSTFPTGAPFGATWFLTLIILSGLFVALEIALRVEPMQPYLLRLVPSLGSRHLQMEEQLARLDRLVATEGQVDCVMLGSSLVWLGFNPPTFETAFRDETGQAIRCFNLGVEALPTNAAAPLAEIIVKKYRPWLLIYGTSARDYAVPGDADDSRVVLDSSWLRYQRGEHTPLTWLVTHSYTLRYAREFSGLLKLDDQTWTRFGASDHLSRGFLGKTVAAQPVHFEAATKDAKQWLQPYEIEQENVQALAHIARLQQHGTEVVLVEMPVSQHYFDYFSEGKKDYEHFVAQITDVANKEKTILLSGTIGVFPDEGWWDRSHMNLAGANAFSQWLAERIAQLVVAGEIGAPEIVAIDNGA